MIILFLSYKWIFTDSGGRIMQKPFVRPYLTTHSLQPENQESPIEFISGRRVGNSLFYRRNHFAYPSLSASAYWLPVNGSVSSPRLYSLTELMNLPSRTVTAILECAGNKRSLFEPKTFGEQWEKGAVSQGSWKGVPLASLLEGAGIQNGAAEVIFEGYDFGERTDSDEVYSFTRSLPLEKALHPDTLVAYEYNGKPIPFKHGFPLRLIVPQWYAMASVKWLKSITVADAPFTGPFQTIDYVYYPHKEKDEGAAPVTKLHVNSSIRHPLDGQILQTGSHPVKGIAWTGKGKIEKVEISTDGGENWKEARLESQASSGYEWQPWVYDWKAGKGEYTLMSRAYDTHGRVQPASPFWNRKGYGYHAIDMVSVKVE